jgi:hypothetical protein
MSGYIIVESGDEGMQVTGEASEEDVPETNGNGDNEEEEEEVDEGTDEEQG